VTNSKGNTMPSVDPTTGGAIAGSSMGFIVLVIGAILIAIIAGISIGGVYLAQKLAHVAGDIGLIATVIFVGVITVMVFVCIFCSTIHPTEMFVDVGPAPGDSVSAAKPEDALLSGISAAEQKVCELIQRTDKYIQSDVGKPGQDDPSLVVAAQRKARAAVPGGRLVDCTASAPEPSLSDADVRLTLMENSLKWFTDPELEAAYKKAMAGCEGFVNGNSDNGPAPVLDLTALQKRLDVINTAIADQHRQYLDPMDKQTERLNRGELSDCQKRMGANAGADAAAGAKQLPPGTTSFQN